MFCRFCRMRDITSIKLVQHIGSQTRTAYHCPNCGEELNVFWTKKKKEKKHDRS